MNPMLRKTLLAAGLAGAFLTAVRAADGPPPAATGDIGTPPPAQNQPMEPHGGRGNRLQELTQTLELTPAQQEQVAAILKSSATQRQELMKQEAADRRAKMHALMTDTQAKVRAVLTPDQQKKFDAMPHPGRGHWGPKGGETNGAPPPAGEHETPPGAT